MIDVMASKARLEAEAQLGARQGVETVMEVLDQREGIESEVTAAVGVEVHRFQKALRYAQGSMLPKGV